METYLKNLDRTELQKAKLVIGQFITSCSHSMRGPLKSITGLANLLQNNKNCSSQDAAMFLDLIGLTVNRMEHTLDELEHFLENSKRKVASKAIDCSELLNIVFRQYEEELSTKHIEINLSVEQTVPFYSDMARLRIILSNIFSNAIQFCDVNKNNRKINITVNTTAQTCIFTISDNGIGIAPENHLKIFQLFFRATERSIGTGVGLYVVKEAIEKMVGNIYVTSALGEGSTFRVILPNLPSG